MECSCKGGVVTLAEARQAGVLEALRTSSANTANTRSAVRTARAVLPLAPTIVLPLPCNPALFRAVLGCLHLTLLMHLTSDPLPTHSVTAQSSPHTQVCHTVLSSDLQCLLLCWYSSSSVYRIMESRCTNNAKGRESSPS